MLHRNQTGLSQLTVLILIISAAIFLFILGLIFRSESNVGTGIEYTDPSGPAIMQESEELYRQLGSDAQFNLIRTDLTAFGKASVDAYKKGDKVVIFTVTKPPSEGGDTMSFEGRFEESKDTITVSLKRLKNERIEATIKNTKTGFSQNKELPSSNARNTFITTLPVGTDDYTIEYLIISDSFAINIYPIDIGSIATIKNAAQAELMKQLGVSSLENEKVQIVTSGSFEYRTEDFPMQDRVIETVN